MNSLPKTNLLDSSPNWCGTDKVDVFGAAQWNRFSRYGTRYGPLITCTSLHLVLALRGSPSEISGEEGSIGPCEQLDAISSFNHFV
nr:hypothetical protein Iba_chr02aCG13750 [Ipomoea batatas]